MPSRLNTQEPHDASKSLPLKGKNHPSGFMGQPEDADRLYKRLIKYVPSAGLHVDIGCGRGRFLELSKAAGMEVLGIDSHRASVHECIAKGIRAIESDAFEYLLHSTDMAITISAVHLVEHLTPTDLQRFLDLSYDHLEVGGRLILVTPNFRDWKVLTEYFWLDPTHVRPYPVPLLKKMAGQAGLSHTTAFTTCGVKVGKRMLFGRPFQRLRYGRQFGRPNSVVIFERHE